MGAPLTHRFWNRVYVFIRREDWLFCPACGRHFGEHELAKAKDCVHLSKGLRIGICRECGD